MGRKKALNPMEAYRRKQKKTQIAKNKKKRAEAKDKALLRRDADWIMAEIQKLNRREKQDHGKNEEKYTNRRKKLLDAYNRAIRIRNIKQKTQRNTANTNEKESNKTETNDSSPTPPPIEAMDDLSKHIDTQSKEDEAHTATATTTTTNNSNAVIPPAPVAYPLPIHPNMHPHPAHMYNHLYNPLLINPYAMPSIYSDTLGAKPRRHNDTTQAAYGQPPPHGVYPPMHHHYPAVNVNPMNNKPMKERAPRDRSDPMNPSNPKYNFIHSTNDEFKQYVSDVPALPIHTPQPQVQTQPVARQSVDVKSAETKATD
eukprot:1160727_1